MSGAHVPNHLVHTVTSRGFVHLPVLGLDGTVSPTPLSGDGTVRVYESSSVEPRVWLGVASHQPAMDEEERTGAPLPVELALHLSVETAQMLSEQLAHLVERHDAREAEDGSWRDEECFRASGEVVCERCSLPYWRHRQVARKDAPTLVRACDGRLLKL